MRSCEISIKGVNALLVRIPLPPDDRLAKQANETHEQHDDRVWREMVHYDKNGYACLVSAQIRKGLVDVAKHLCMQVPGKGKATYTKRFERGVALKETNILIEPKVKKADLQSTRIYVPSKPQDPKGGKVWRTFPTFPEWSCKFTLLILDADINEGVLRKHLEGMGLLIGIGAMRVGNGGEGGQFEITSFKWREN